DYARDFGGVRYLFCRGIDATRNDGQGIHAWRFDPDLVHALDALFAGDSTRSHAGGQGSGHATPEPAGCAPSSDPGEGPGPQTPNPAGSAPSPASGGGPGWGPPEPTKRPSSAPSTEAATSAPSTTLWPKACAASTRTPPTPFSPPPPWPRWPLPQATLASIPRSRTSWSTSRSTGPPPRPGARPWPPRTGSPGLTPATPNPPPK